MSVVRKIVCGILAILGALIISLGIFLQLNPQKEEKDKEKTSEEDYSFSRINTFNDEETCKTYNQVQTYLYTNTYDKISFSYPDCVHEYTLSFWSKILETEDGSIRIDISKQKKNINTYMNGIKTQMISEKNGDDYYSNYTYTDVAKFTNKNGIEIQVVEANYQVSIVYTTDYDLWYVAAKLDDENTLVYNIISKGKVMSYKAIQEMFDNLKVEKEKAVFMNTKKDGDYQVGSIHQNKYKSYQHGYRVNLKVPSKYPEIDSFTSNYDESVFEYKDIDKEIYVSLSIDTDNFYTYDEKMTKANEISKNGYTNSELYRNIQNSGVKKEVIKGKEISYFVTSYDIYVDNKKASTRYVGEAYYEIEKGHYYKIYMSNKTQPIDSKFISEFLDVTIEEY